MEQSVFKVAKKFGELSEGAITNLKLQKIIYIAHMIWIGRYKKPLIEEPFQAWMYGPVLPSLYEQVKMFGAEPIKDVFPVERIDESSEEAKFLNNIWHFFGEKEASELVYLTHRPGGAWDKNYLHGAKSNIPDVDIIKEYEVYHER